MKQLTLLCTLLLFTVVMIGCKSKPVNPNEEKAKKKSLWLKKP